MSDTIEVKGTVNSVETVDRIAGNFESVVVTNEAGDQTTIIGKITELLRKSGSGKAKGFKLIHSDGREETFLGVESPGLYTKDAAGARVPREVPAGARVSAIDSGKGGLV